VNIAASNAAMHQKARRNVVAVMRIVVSSHYGNRSYEENFGEAIMDISEPKSVTVPEIALIAATRGAIGFGAGLLLAEKFKRHRRKVLGWTLFLSGLASTVPIALHVFGKKKQVLLRADD
jgi:hypothetical protein